MKKRFVLPLLIVFLFLAQDYAASGTAAAQPCGEESEGTEFKTVLDVSLCAFFLAMTSVILRSRIRGTTIMGFFRGEDLLQKESNPGRLEKESEAPEEVEQELLSAAKEIKTIQDSVIVRKEETVQICTREELEEWIQKTEELLRKMQMCKAKHQKIAMVLQCRARSEETTRQIQTVQKRMDELDRCIDEINLLLHEVKQMRI